MVYSQETNNTNPLKFKNSLGEMKISFNDKEDQFLKIGLSNQVWIRSINNNPGTTVNGTPQNNTIDAGLRRTRLTTLFQMSKAYSVFFQFGINNQSFNTGGGSGTGANGMGKKPAMFFMDAYADFAIIPRNDYKTNKANKNNLYIGAGLHSWNGISRLTNASTTKLFTADLPVFNFPNIEMSDQFSRQFGIFAHGALDRINYRFSINKPFATNRIPVAGAGTVENNSSGKLSYSGYVAYQFKDRETTVTTFMPGTYLGTKSILNIGAGFYTNKEAFLEQTTNKEFVKHDQTNLGLDIYWEVPIGNKSKEMSISLYSVLYYNDFGTNYLRTSGIMNPGIADTTYIGQIAAEGFGNSKYLSGTGNIWYTQGGYVLPKFSEYIKLQPYFAYHLKDLKALNQIGHFYDIGTNIFLYSQNTKISLQYSNRPLYAKDTKTVFTRKSEILLALIVAL